MTADPVAARYAEALFGAAKAEGAVDEALGSLSLIGSLMAEHPPLRELMANPDVDPDDKVGVCERTLLGSWSPLVRAFVQMVVSAWRAEHLPQIVEAFQALVERDRGLVRVTVRCAHPPSDAVLRRLKEHLEHRQRQHVELTTEVDTNLLGGLQVFIGNRVIDTSVARQLHDLRARLTAVKVV